LFKTHRPVTSGCLKRADLSLPATTSDGSAMS
jgi:hypothetical protein